MFKSILSLLSKPARTVTFRICKGAEETPITCPVGSNLMDVTNSLVNQNVNIYGLCDKQLACTTCRVDLETHYHLLPPPSDEEVDVLLTTNNFRQESSRMACQITVGEELEGMKVRIAVSSSPKSS